MQHVLDRLIYFPHAAFTFQISSQPDFSVNKTRYSSDENFSFYHIIFSAAKRNSTVDGDFWGKSAAEFIRISFSHSNNIMKLLLTKNLKSVVFVL